MKIKIVLLFITLLFMVNFISAWSNEAVCGNNQCEAGYNFKDSNYLEDISTCFEDCSFTDWIVCDVSLVNGGDCNFNGKIFKFTNLERTGCGGTPGSNLNFDLEYQGLKLSFSGAEPYSYISAFDDFSVSYAIWPCAVATTQQRFYLKGKMDTNKFDNFMKIETNNINLKEIAASSFDLIFTFDYKGLSGPRVNFDIKHSETGESLGSGIITGSLEQRITLYPDSVNPGKYLVIAKILDLNDENIIYEQTSNLIVNQCSINADCGDGKFWTKDICSREEYNVCSNQLNYVTIGLVLGGVLIILLFLIFRKRK